MLIFLLFIITYCLVGGIISYAIPILCWETEVRGTYHKTTINTINERGERWGLNANIPFEMLGIFFWPFIITWILFYMYVLTPFKIKLDNYLDGL